MDELDKKRRQLSDPQGHISQLDEEALINLTPAQRKSLQVQLEFEKQLTQAFRIEVPEALADKIIFQQRLRTRKKPRPLWAIAASSLLLIGISFLFWPKSYLSLTSEALAHVENEAEYLALSQLVAPGQVEKHLKKMGFTLQQLPEKVVFATRCGLAGQDSLHLIAKVDGQPVSLLITRQNNNTANVFTDGKRFGKFISEGKENLIVIADSLSLVDKFLAKIHEV